MKKQKNINSAILIRTTILSVFVFVFINSCQEGIKYWCRESNRWIDTKCFSKPVADCLYRYKSRHQFKQIWSGL